MHSRKLPIVIALSFVLVLAALSVQAREATPTVEPTTDTVVTMIPVATNGSEATAEMTTAAENTAEATIEAVATTSAITSPTAEETATAEATTPILVSPTPERAAREEAPAGVSTLVLLVGIGAVLLVGGMILARENSRKDVDGD